MGRCRAVPHVLPPHPCSPPDLCCLMKPNRRGCHKPRHTIGGHSGSPRAEPRQAKFVLSSSGSLTLRMKEAESRRSREAALLRRGEKGQKCSPAPSHPRQPSVARSALPDTGDTWLPLASGANAQAASLCVQVVLANTHLLEPFYF